MTRRNLGLFFLLFVVFGLTAAVTFGANAEDAQSSSSQAHTTKKKKHSHKKTKSKKKSSHSRRGKQTANVHGTHAPKTNPSATTAPAEPSSPLPPPVKTED